MESPKNCEWWKSQAEGWQGHYVDIKKRSDYFEKEWDKEKSRAYGWKLAFWSLVILLAIYVVAVPHQPVSSDQPEYPTTVAE